MNRNWKINDVYEVEPGYFPVSNGGFRKQAILSDPPEFRQESTENRIEE